MPRASPCRGSTGLEWKSRLAPVACELGRAHTGDSLWDLEGDLGGLLGKVVHELESALDLLRYGP